MQTPVLAAGRIFGVWNQLHCLDVRAGLKPLWTSDEADFAHYASLIATDERVLVTTLKGELLLLDARGDKFELLGRLKALPDEEGCHAHPARVGTRLYLRGSASVVCLELQEP